MPLNNLLISRHSLWAHSIVFDLKQNAATKNTDEMKMFTSKQTSWDPDSYNLYYNSKIFSPRWLTGLGFKWSKALFNNAKASTTMTLYVVVAKDQHFYLSTAAVFHMENINSKLKKTSSRNQFVLSKISRTCVNWKYNHSKWLFTN